METVFISNLKAFLDIAAEEMELYVPERSGERFIYNRYDSSGRKQVDFNNIRAGTSVKEFLFPVRELASVTPGRFEPDELRPFAVFGLQQCDIRSMSILDKVFIEEEFEDRLYTARRKKMFIISTDCTEPGESCFCNLFDGRGFVESGFDLNVSEIKDGFIIETGSSKGKDFVDRHSELFGEVPAVLLSLRDKNRAGTQKQLEQQNAELRFDRTIREIVESSQEAEVYDEEAEKCIECQACTRVCPTCHCFYLYDEKRKDYFTKMKMWDSCMRYGYAAVAGGANPRKTLGDRLKHRLLHKFVYFMDRYGIEMCVGCGRCVDADAGGIDLRQVLKELSEKAKSQAYPLQGDKPAKGG